LLSGEILVAANIWHRSQNISKGTSPRSLKRRLKNFPMFLLSAAVVLCSALLQCFDQLFRHLANHQLCHLSTPDFTLASNASNASSWRTALFERCYFRRKPKLMTGRLGCETGRRLNRLSGGMPSFVCNPATIRRVSERRRLRTPLTRFLPPITGTKSLIVRPDCSIRYLLPPRRSVSRAPRHPVTAAGLGVVHRPVGGGHQLLSRGFRRRH